MFWLILPSIWIHWTASYTICLHAFHDFTVGSYIPTLKHVKVGRAWHFLTCMSSVKGRNGVETLNCIWGYPKTQQQKEQRQWVTCFTCLASNILHTEYIVGWTVCPFCIKNSPIMSCSHAWKKIPGSLCFQAGEPGNEANLNGLNIKLWLKMVIIRTCTCVDYKRVHGVSIYWRLKICSFWVPSATAFGLQITNKTALNFNCIHINVQCTQLWMSIYDYIHMQ